MTINALYKTVKDRIAVYRRKLDGLYTYFQSGNAVVYIALPDWKQYWFMQVETVTKHVDYAGTHSLSITGRGVRAYFRSPVSPACFTDSRHVGMAGQHSQRNAADFLRTPPIDTLTRYEVFGNINAHADPDRISFSDLMKNCTVSSAGDYAIGLLPWPHFPGNFARAAAHMLGDTIGPSSGSND